MRSGEERLRSAGGTNRAGPANPATRCVAERGAWLLPDSRPRCVQVGRRRPWETVPSMPQHRAQTTFCIRCDRGRGSGIAWRKPGKKVAGARLRVGGDQAILWAAPADPVVARGDGALGCGGVGRWIGAFFDREAKAVSRFACHRSPGRSAPFAHQRFHPVLIMPGWPGRGKSLACGDRAGYASIGRANECSSNHPQPD
jgi:hypothetical protein